MGGHFSQPVADAKERDGKDFAFDGIKPRSKEIAGLVKKLSEELPELERLEARNCKLKVIPGNLSDLTKLEVLSLPGNKLSQLNKDLLNCKSLTELNLSGNGFKNGFPPEIAGISSLLELNFTGNQLNSFAGPQSRSDYQSLERLILERNEFTHFPNNVCSLIGIRVLNLNENCLNSIPAEEFGRLVNLRELYLRRTQISEIPYTIEKLRQLTHLDCSENQLRSIPPQIAHLTRLQVLEAQHNQIETISEELCGVASLSTIKLHDNNITTIPTAIANLVNLNELILAENKIQVLPPEIARLSNLRKLFLEYNCLTVLPEEIGELKNLLVLILHNNQLTTLPQCITTMTNLLRLSLNDNQLHDQIVRQIQNEGALSLITERKEMITQPGDINDSISKKYMSLRRRELKKTASLHTLGPDQSNNSPENVPAKVHEKLVKEPSKKKGISLTSNREKSKDAETGVPSYSKFKFAFDSLLQEQDFSKKKKEMLKKLPDGEKWTLLTQYKGSTLELLRNQTNSKSSKSRRTSTQKSAADYVTMLKENRVNKNIMSRMIASLKENSEGWASKFIVAGGIPALTHLVRQSLTKKVVSARDNTSVESALEIFRLLLNVSIKSVLTSSGAVGAITLPLAVYYDQNRWASIELLESICSEEIHMGPRLVLEAIDAQSLETGEEFRFFAFLQCLESDETPPRTKVVCLSLINQLVDSIPGLEERFEMRTEFMRMGFQGLLAQLKSDKNAGQLLQVEREFFDTETKNDYEDMRCRFNRKAVIEKMSAHSKQGNLRVTLVTETLHANFVTDITPDTTPSEVISLLVDKYHITNPDDYGLYVPPGEGDDDKEVWLPLKEPIAGAQLNPDRMGDVEFRMIPWDVVVHLPSGQLQQLNLDPSATCEQVLNILLEVNKLPAGSEYCLKVSDEVLQEQKSIFSSSLVQLDNRNKLVLCERPLRLKVILGEETSQMMEFDPNLKMSEVFEVIASHVNLSRNFDLLLETDEKTVPIDSLDPNLILKSVVNPDRTRLRLAPKNQEEDEYQEVEDLYIWDEPPDDPSNITFEKGKENAIQHIQTATFNKLVARVTSPDEYDVDFVNVFVMMYHAFTTDEKLWQKLEERFNVPDCEPVEKRQKIQMRVFIFLKHWVEKITDLSTQVKQSIQKFVTLASTNNSEFEIFAKTIASRLATPKAVEDSIPQGKVPIPFLPKNILSGVPTLSDFEELEIARQLTLQTFAIFKRIKASEFFKSAWTKEKYKHLCPNVLEMISHYNQVSAWVTTAVVNEPLVRMRVKMLQRIINIAEKLRELNNFHLLSAFVSAVNNVAVNRLKFTVARLSKRHRMVINELESVMSMEGSFSNFRAALSTARAPCIPFLGVYLTDLIFIGEGNPDMVENRINFCKHKIVYTVVSTIQTYQSQVYHLETVDSIQTFVNNLPRLPDKELYSMSMAIEPRGAQRADIL